jgi:Colicin V production protein.
MKDFFITISNINIKNIESNWLLILVLLILGGYALYGRHKGFIKTVFSLFSIIAALIITVWISPIVSKQVQQNDQIMGFITTKVEKVLKTSSTEKTKVNNKSNQVSYINTLPFPKAVKMALIENNNSDIYEAMAVNSFKEYVSSSIARIIVNAGAFIFVMLIVLILLSILCEALNIISKLPLINGLNKTAGLFAGVLQGFVIIWIGCIVITMLGSTKFGQSIFETINKNTFLSLIYNNNLFLKFITNLGSTLF